MALPVPRRQEIDHRTIKLVVGLIALTLPGLTDGLSSSALTSISASYYEGGWPQSIFIGFLFAIAAFLLAYNGRSRRQMLMSKFAAVAGLSIALFPCECGTHPALVPYVHGIAAALMFLILAYFCYAFYKRARAKGYAQANARAVIYAMSGLAIILAIVVLGYDNLARGALTSRVPRLTFIGESVGLYAFAISWLTASHVTPFLARADEFFLPFRADNPD